MITSFLSKVVPMPFSRLSMGILWMLVSVFLFSVNDVLYKYLSLQIPPERTIMWRSLISLVLLGLYGFFKEKEVLQPMPKNKLLLHIGRGIFASLSFLIMGYALKGLKIASFMSIYYACPLTLIILSAVFLKEKITTTSLKRIILGLVGVLVIFTPGSDVLSLYGVWAVISMLLFAVSVIIAKKMKDEPHFRLLLYYIIISFLVSLVVEFHQFQWPSADILVRIACMSPIHIGAFWAFSQAIRLEEVQKIAPLEYTGLLWGVLFGYLVFAETPCLPVMAGACLIIGSGLLFKQPHKTRS